MNTLNNRLAMGEKEKAVLQEELDKERYFYKGYKHNVEIWRKNKAKAKQKNKVLIKKLHDENEEIKGSTTRLKSHDEEWKNLRQKVKIWETMERKWIEALFFHKKQHEALDHRMKTLTKEKKKKENVLTKLELINLKYISLL